MTDSPELQSAERARSILATDCGSTNTKAILIEQQADGTYRLVVRGEAPTTVEAPFDDVTVGVRNAVLEVEELSGKTLLGPEGRPITPALDGTTGVDLYLSTSSAGGGLQMTVAGVVKAMSAESAQRAALGVERFCKSNGGTPWEAEEAIHALQRECAALKAALSEHPLATEPRPGD